MKLAVFDCDGTLVDSQAAVCEAMETAFSAAALPTPSRQAIRHIVGLSLPQALRRLAPAIDDEQHAIVLESYKDAFRQSRIAGRLDEPLFDGIRELLDKLRDEGWALAVATGKSDRGLTSCLASHGLSNHFTSLQTADRHPSKPHPAMLEAAMFEAGAHKDDTVMIGDTSYDMAMAIHAGVRPIGVDWGYHTVDDLIASGAHAVATSAAQLEALIQ